MRVRDIMTEKVITILQGRKVMLAGDVMDSAEVRHMPVVDADDRVVGIVSRTDLLRASPRNSGLPQDRFYLKRHLTQLQVKDIMSRSLCIDPDATVQAAARLMRARKVNCLPVVDRRHRILGIITSFDTLALLEHLDSATLPAGSLN